MEVLVLKHALFGLSLLMAVGVGEARADTQVASVGLGSRDAVTKVLVLKGERRLLLLNGEKVLQLCRRVGAGPHQPKMHQGWSNAGRRVHHRLAPIEQPVLSCPAYFYPNRQDVELARDMGVQAGGMIMIHGQPSQFDVRYLKLEHDWTQGCIAVSNVVMDELWSSVRDGTPIEIRP
ncbi:MAG: L,D-transpeptidase family protein [Rhodospirillales bacterium]|nr:L,D-transpeptidase family protein [Rhodospirillales bacterium]